MTSADHPAHEATAAIARQFLAARQAARGLAAYPGALPATLAQAYAIQDYAIAAQEKAVAGWKVGRILPPDSASWGAERLAGPILADTIVEATAGAPGLIFADGFGAAEAEFLLRIGAPPERDKMHFSLAESWALVDAVHIGIEIASSPFTGINSHGPAVTISDFGNNNGLLIGPAIADFGDADLTGQTVSLSIDGAVVGTGQAAAFPDGIVGALRFLLENLAQRAIPLPAGTWVSSGAITGVHPVRVGQHVTADFGPFGRVGCVIEAQSPAR